MSEINVPKETTPSVNPQANPPDDYSFSSSSSSSMDFIIPSPDARLNPYTTIKETPQLEAPASVHVSLSDFFRATTQASTALRQQLSASDQVDQLTRRKSSQSAALQAKTLAEMYEQRNEALKGINEEAKKALEDLRKLLENMRNESLKQKE